MVGVLSFVVLIALCLLNVRENHWVSRSQESAGEVPVIFLFEYPEKYEGRLVLVSGTVTGFYSTSNMLFLKTDHSEVRVLLKEGSGVNVGDDVTVCGRVVLASKGYIEAIWVHVHHYSKMGLYLSACGSLVLVYYLLSSDSKSRNVYGLDSGRRNCSA